MIECSFDKGDARDESGNGISGVLSQVDTGKGKVGLALWFKKTGNSNGKPKASILAKGPTTAPAGSFVQDRWTGYVPVVVKAMAMAGKTVFISGPPDSLDEEYAFSRMVAKDKAINAELEEHDASLDGKRGGRLWGISAETGQPINNQQLELKSPPVWDGLIVAQGRLFEAAMDGKVVAFGVPK
jgi:hypothetical protein